MWCIPLVIDVTNQKRRLPNRLTIFLGSRDDPLWTSAKPFPNDCVCGSQFNLEHSLSCKKGGFVTLCHNTVRDLTADLLSEVCKDVRIEPPLNQLTGETLDKASNTSNEARLDIAARRF